METSTRPVRAVSSLSRARRAGLTAVVTACASIGFSERAFALDIVLSFNSAVSANPADDPAGTLLTQHMQAVEAFYEDVFEDAHTITISYWYGNQGAGILAAHSLVSQSGGRETSGQIVFSPDAAGTGWFFDPTPGDNAEFNMSQTLWRNLSAANQTNFYNSSGTIPATFEAGFSGSNNGSNPNVAGNTDMLSVAIHETGHSLGMSSANTATQTETNVDFDYDFDSANVFGATLAARTAATNNLAHLADSAAVMFPSIGTALRRLPGHTDLLSMAAVHDYFTLDLPRREYYGGVSNWNANTNWSGNNVPGNNDDAFVRANGNPSVIASLSASAVAGSLTVAEGAGVTTNNFSLSVTNAVTVTGAGSAINFNGGSFSCATLNVNTSGQVLLTAGGNKVLRAGAISTATSGKIDMSDNDAVINYTGSSPLAAIRAFITQGYNGGLWTGAGITSSAAAALAASAHKTALGYGEVAQIGAGTFTATDLSTVLIRYVYAGDANLDGTVDTVDFNNLASNFSGTNRIWSQADFDYNQTVDTVDFNLLASNFSLVLPASDAISGDFASAAVPEPASAALIAIGFGTVAIRRRR